MSNTHILITGGTFDKEYDELTGHLFFRKTHVPEMLKLGRSLVDPRISTLFMIDSLEMTDEHRARVVKHCLEIPESKIVITHGTDTMERTAQALGAAITSDLGKTIVLTGAMVPYAFGSSDGLFNLGAALAYAQSLPAGVYVAMNGIAFNWNEVTKDRTNGVFRKK